MSDRAQPSSLVTSAEIARALGCSKQNAQKRLASLRPDGERVVSGNVAKAWFVTSLPPSLLGRLSEIAEGKRYSSVLALLAEPLARYEVSDADGKVMSLAEIAQAARHRAANLRTAFRPLLQLRNDPSVTTADFQARGIHGYPAGLR